MVLTTPKSVAQAYAKYGSLKAAARNTETSWGAIHRLYEQAVSEGLMDALPRGAKTKDHTTATIKGKVKAKTKPVIEGKRKAIKIKPLPRTEGKVSRFLFTCAQNNTKLHEQLWENLQVLASHYKAQIHVSRFSYIKAGLGARGDKAHWFEAQGERVKTDFWFDPRIADFVSDNRVEVAPGLVWVGDANISPTRSRPLSGYEALTGRRSGIFPHVKIAMESIAAEANQDTKFNYTTGTITMRNYIQRGEGLKAEFHHCYGCLLAEVDENGHWWCRQINADSEGTIYDLDVCVKKGILSINTDAEHILEAISWGDIHEAQLPADVRALNWGEGGILDTLRPKYQFMHDLLDFYSRNHHNIDDPHEMFLRFVEGKDNVRKEVCASADFLQFAHRPWCQTIIVNSNHDRALLRWLKNRTAMYDPVNFAFWSCMNSRVTAYMAANKESPIVFREAYFEVTGQIREPKGIRFLRQDESFVICPAAGGGIECGDHLDIGANGSRACNGSFAKMGRKVSGGHTHSSGIWDGEYRSGACIRRANYSHGPSSWSVSHVCTYPNGKRFILTQYAGKWRA